MPAGRPSSYTSETGNIICERLSLGESLREICSGEGMPDKATVMRWLHGNLEFRDQYAKARELQSEHWAEEILEIADDGANDWMERQNKDGSSYEAVNSEHINRSRLRVDTRKWLMARMAPKRFGDRVTNEMVGKDGGAIQVDSLTTEDRARALAVFLAKTKVEK